MFIVFQKLKSMNKKQSIFSFYDSIYHILAHILKELITLQYNSKYNWNIYFLMLQFVLESSIICMFNKICIRYCLPLHVIEHLKI